MKTWRLLALAAATTTAGLSAGLPVRGAPPASEPPPATTPAEEPNAGSTPPDSVPADEPGESPDEEGVVHSWALAPAGLDESGGNRPNLSYSAAPGQVISDAVTLYNFGTEDLPFRVYATDAYNNEDGGFALLPGSDVPTGAGAWIKLDAQDITVPAGKQATIPFTLTVPENASPGDHVGAVVASSPTLGRGEDQETLILDRRTGTRLYVRVDGALEPELTIENVATDYSGSANPLGGSATVTYRVENRGNVRLSGTTVASVSGPFGLARTRSEAVPFVELLPGEGFDVTAELSDVPALGLLSTDVSLNEVTEGDGEPVDDVNRSTRSVALPITVLLALLLLIFALLAARAVRRHRERPEVLSPVEAREREYQST